MRPAALLRSPATGIAMLVSSNQAGIQFYSGNFLDGIPGKDGAMYVDMHIPFPEAKNVTPCAGITNITGCV